MIVAWDSLRWPGKTAAQINSRIETIPPADVTVVSAGTCNIEKQNSIEVTSEIEKVIQNVSKLRPNKPVIMCQIPNRYGNKSYLNDKIDVVNSYIAKEVSKKDNWVLLSHEVNSGDFYDGLHFNERGKAKFAHEVRHLVREICKSKQ